MLDFFAATNIYDSDGSVKKVAYVPDFLSKEPSSLPLKADETKALGQVSNTIEEYVWVLIVNAPGSSQETRTVQVYRLVEALCDTDTDGEATAGECDDLADTDEIKELNYLKVF